ncbi:xylose isomerase [Aliifodinibius salipaludis]|uniref:Xylose isomerase n=1 Tax=Fodinibius salipaludis TaxID=2032627 RepID=A0A2A2GAT7_9BACT|nr:TIM barrel protein [Aliifodinibius salipaludis]PAU93932.1 xylose isomerase [Aliifodinibius salipaludis]
MNRLQFLKYCSFASASVGIPGLVHSIYETTAETDLFFNISLAEWSLHRTLRAGKIDHLEFPVVAKKEFGISAVEYVNQFFADKAEDISYLNEMNSRCSDLGVDQLLIMVDGEGDLAGTNKKERRSAVEKHYKWVRAAQHLGCHSIRVNLFGDGNRADQKRAAVDSLGRLSEFAKDFDINILVENHGGYSSDGKWLVDVMREVGMKNCGTLPDFGNFCIQRKDGKGGDAPCIEEYNRYNGVKEMVPFAKAVSAKSYDFDETGRETTINFMKMGRIIRDADYTAHFGIEYEGSKLSEFEGIKATKDLLVKVGKKLSQ